MLLSNTGKYVFKFKPEVFYGEQALKLLHDNYAKADNVKQQLLLPGELKVNLLHAIFRFQYSIVFRADKNFPEHILYTIDLTELFKIILIVVLCSTFFSKYSLSGYLWFNGIFAIVFYVLNVVFMQTQIINVLQQVFEKEVPELPVVSDTKTKNGLQCPACAEPLSGYEYNCPECGLTLRDGKPPQNTQITKYKSFKLRYVYSKK